MSGKADHPITITPHDGEVRVLHEQQEVVRTRKALLLKEANYPAVLYMPREDTNMGLLTPSSRTTHCPYKGNASYFDLPDAPDAVWSYETPKAEVEGISGYLAFYPDKVTIEA